MYPFQDCCITQTYKSMQWNNDDSFAVLILPILCINIRWASATEAASRALSAMSHWSITAITLSIIHQHIDISAMPIISSDQKDWSTL